MEEKEKTEMIKMIADLNKRLEEGRDYLMGVPDNEITAEDALEALGFGRNGYGG